MEQFSDDDLLRLPYIIGRTEITPEEAEANRIAAEKQRTADEAAGRKPKKDGKPKRPRKAIKPLIPVSESTWWAGVKSGRFPKPVKLGPRTDAWRFRDIYALMQNFS